MGKQVKVGVDFGGGQPPGYLWAVWVIDLSFEEAIGFLNKSQYQHMSMQFRELARDQDPTHPVSASVDAVEDFYELRDKGGILGNMNVRVFFHLDKQNHVIVVLGAIKKQNDGPTPIGDKRRMARRKRKYLNGDYGQP
jgi:hypothetical protein